MGSHSVGSDDDWLTIGSSFDNLADNGVHSCNDEDNGGDAGTLLLVRKRKEQSKTKSKKKDKRDHKRLRRQRKQKESRSSLDKLSYHSHATKTLHRDSSLYHTVDTIGDDENLFYGTLSKKDAPMYYLNKRSNLRENVPIIRYYDKQGTEATVNLDDDCYVDRSISSEHDLDLVSFIPLNSRSAISFRNEVKDTENYLKQRKEVFDIQLQQNPNDIETWVDYICFQSKKHHSDGSESLHRSVRRNKSTSLVSAQSFYAKKALAHNKDSKVLERLWLQLDLYLAEIESKDSIGSCGQESLQRRIEELLILYPSSEYLWRRLIQCQQQNFSDFTVSAIRDTFARLIATYRTKVSHPTSTTSLQPDAIDTESNESNIDKLLRFHCLYCRFERKAGYTERAIANAKTLMDYNKYLSNRRKHQPTASNDSHLSLWREFHTQYWKSDQLQGEDQTSRSEVSEVRFYSFPTSLKPPHTFAGALNDHLDRQWSTLKAGIIPHAAVLTKNHEQSMLEDSLCHSHDSIEPVLCDKPAKHIGDTAPVSSEDQTVYSNLHGYRIQLGKVNDGAEYESILHELRNGLCKTNGQHSTGRKQRRAQSTKENMIERLRDERIDHLKSYKMLEEDIYFDWLHQEFIRSTCHWMPLNPNHAGHKALLSEQPERAILSEETLPFVFPVADDQQIKLITNLLEQCGVKDKNLVLPTLYIDDFKEYEVLAQPLLSILTQIENEKERLRMEIPLENRLTLLQDSLLSTIVITDSTVLYDDMKQEFVRSILMSPFDEGAEYSQFTYMKLLTMYFEFEVLIARVVQEDHNRCKEEVSSFIQDQQTRCLQLMSKYDIILSSAQNTAHKTHDAEVVGITAFALYAISVGNIKQANKLCDRSLASIRDRARQNSSYPKNFHFLIFLRSRNELWRPILRSHAPEQLKSSRLKTLYILGFGLINAPPFLESLEKIAAKKGNELVQYLDSILSDCITSLIIDSYRSEVDTALCACTKHQSGTAQCQWWGRCCSVGHTLHNLCLAIYAADGFGAAKMEYEKYINTKEISSELNVCCHHEWITLSYLEFLSRHQASQASPTLTPHAWSEQVANAAIKYPKDLHLRLLADSVGGRSLVVSQPLRRFFAKAHQRAERQFSSLKISEWLFFLLCEIMRLERVVNVHNYPVDDSNQRDFTESCCLWHHWKCNRAGVDRVRNLFEEMVEGNQMRQCALFWRLYLRFEVAMGKIGAAKKVFYRGLSVCPWSRALYLDGLAVCRPYFSERECDDVVQWMVAGGLNIRKELE